MNVLAWSNGVKPKRSLKKNKPEPIKGDLPFSNKTFVITGVLSIERDDAKNVIQSNGYQYHPFYRDRDLFAIT